VRITASALTSASVAGATEALADCMQAKFNERIFLSPAMIGARLAPPPEGLR